MITCDAWAEPSSRSMHEEVKRSPLLHSSLTFTLLFKIQHPKGQKENKTPRINTLFDTRHQTRFSIFWIQIKMKIANSFLFTSDLLVTCMYGFAWVICVVLFLSTSRWWLALLVDKTMMCTHALTGTLARTCTKPTGYSIYLLVLPSSPVNSPTFRRRVQEHSQHKVL